jgi:hypothetical protein
VTKRNALRNIAVWASVAAGLLTLAPDHAVSSPARATGPSSITHGAVSYRSATRIAAPLPTALDVLARIPVENEHPAGYDRRRFGYPAIVENFCDTRATVLIRESLTPAQVDPYGCGIVAGDWYSSYDGAIWSDPGEVQIDHVVALKEAWDSGAWAWSDARLVQFGNDLTDRRHLRVVTSSANLSKGASDPSNWIPAHAPAVCTYLGDWISIKARWSLSMDHSEAGRIRNLISDRCPGLTIDPWPETPPDPGPTTTTTTTPTGGTCDPAYPTVCIPPPPPDLDCGEIAFRNFTVLPPDPHRFDADNDGVGCES